MSSLIPLHLQYDALAKGSSVLGMFSTRYLSGKAWKLITNKKPPENPAQPGVLWSEAIVWGAVTGMAAGIVGVIVQRLAAEWWRKTQGAIPGKSEG
jgi:hypothetical protein